jgi:hypothetical protein
MQKNSQENPLANRRQQDTHKREEYDGTDNNKHTHLLKVNLGCAFTTE